MDGQIKLATDLLASAMSGSIPPNWWGFGIPPEVMVKTPRTSQVADMIGKAPIGVFPMGGHTNVGYFKRKQKNPQAHGYRCSLHPGVFQSIDFPQGT